MPVKIDKHRYRDINAYITKDGSEIRELMHPSASAARNQSLAEAIVAPGAQTQLHRHRQTEEIYHVTAGEGRMRLGDSWFEIEAGDTVLITPGTPHQLDNSGPLPLVILCACSPPYSHQDTELLTDSE